MDLTIHRFDRFSNGLGVIHDLCDEMRVEEINGEDSLSFSCSDDVTKGDMLVMIDGSSRWHEYRVNDVSRERINGVPMYTVQASASFEEMIGDYIEDLRPGVTYRDANCLTCLESALSTSRWEAGTIDITDLSGVMMYHETALEAVRDVVDTFNGEIRPTIEVTGSQVTGRKIDILARLGNVTNKRFVYRKDLVSCKREITTDEIYSACYAWGKGEELEDDEGEATGAYGRRIGISDVTPDGLPYVHDDDLLPIWGRPDGEGGYAHVFGEFMDENCEDPQELYEEALLYLEQNSTPVVSYSLDVVDLAAYGYNWEGTSLGDTVAIIDDDLGIEAQGRVLKIEWNDLDPTQTKITIGNVADSLDDILTKQEKNWKSVQNSKDLWDSAAAGSANYIEQIREGLNAAFTEAGSYVYFSDSDGLICSNVPLKEVDGVYSPVDPTVTPVYAIQIAKGMFRISSSLLSDGSFNWTTWGTGAGFYADEIISGTLRSVYIMSNTGDNWWDLENGILHFSEGRIESADGSSYWDLTTGEMNLIASVDLSDVYAQIALTNDNLTTSITMINNELAVVEGEFDELSEEMDETNDRITEITAYFRQGIDESGNPILDIGTTANELTVELTNEELRFLEYGSVIASISGQVLYISDAEITDKLQIGNYIWLPREDDHMSLKYVG